MIHRLAVPLRRRALLRAATWPVAVVLAGHGLVHLLGVALQWRLAEVGELRYAEAVPTPGSLAGLVAGGFWLLATALFGAAAVLLVGALIIDATTAVITDPDQSEQAFAWFRHDRDDIDRYRDGLTLDGQGLDPLTLSLAKLLPASTREAGDAGWVCST